MNCWKQQNAEQVVYIVLAILELFITTKISARTLPRRYALESTQENNDKRIASSRQLTTEKSTVNLRDVVFLDDIKLWKRDRTLKKFRKRRATPEPANEPLVSLYSNDYEQKQCRLYIGEKTYPERLIYDCLPVKDWILTDLQNATSKIPSKIDKPRDCKINIVGVSKQSAMFLILSDVRRQWKVPDLVTELRLRQLNIGIVESGAFAGVKNLVQKIDLGQNSIAYISRKAFSGLRNLKELDLSKNRIQYLPRRLFFGLTRLTSLNVAHNELETLHTGSFRNVLELTYLNLSHNLLEDISEEVLQSINTAQSTTVDISYNKLTKPRAGWLLTTVKKTCLLNGEQLSTTAVSLSDIPIKRDLNFTGNYSLEIGAVLAPSGHVLLANGNPWNCRCEVALNFTQTLIETFTQYQLPNHCDNVYWNVDLPCSIPGYSTAFNLGSPETSTPILFKQCCNAKSNHLQSCNFIKAWLERNEKEYGISNEQVTIIGIIIVICIPVLLTASPDCNRPGGELENPKVKIAAIKSAQLACGVVTRVTKSELTKPDTKLKIIPGKRYYDDYSDPD